MVANSLAFALDELQALSVTTLLEVLEPPRAVKLLESSAQSSMGSDDIDPSKEKRIRQNAAMGIIYVGSDPFHSAS